MTGSGTRLPVVGSAPAPGPPSGFQRIAIVGIGAVGGSLAMALRHAWPGALVIGVDASDVIEAAMRLHAIDVGSADLAIAGDADLVVLAAGPDENARVLPFLADAIAGEAIVLALGGGERVGELARSLPGRLPVVAGLPSIELRGTGIHAASPDLMRGRSWTFAPVTAARKDMERMHGLVRAIGGDPDTEPLSA